MPPVVGIANFASAPKEDLADKIIKGLTIAQGLTQTAVNVQRIAGMDPESKLARTKLAQAEGAAAKEKRQMAGLFTRPELSDKELVKIDPRAGQFVRGDIGLQGLEQIQTDDPTARVATNRGLLTARERGILAAGDSPFAQKQNVGLLGEGGEFVAVDREGVAKFDQATANKRKEVKQASPQLEKDVQVMRGMIAQVDDAGGFDKMTGAQDFNLLKGFNQFNDTARVTDSEVAAVKQNQNLISKAQVLFKNWTEGDTLSPELRRDIISATKNIARAAEEGRKEVLSPILADISASGIPRNRVFSPGQIDTLDNNSKLVAQFEGVLKLPGGRVRGAQQLAQTKKQAGGLLSNVGNFLSEQFSRGGRKQPTANAQTPLPKTGEIFIHNGKKMRKVEGGAVPVK